MVAMLHPGVYVQEIPSRIRSIEGAPTSTTIFVGETERGPIGPTKIKSRTEYERLFGGYRRARGSNDSPVDALDATRVLMKHHIDGFFQNGGSTAYIVRAMDGWDDPRNGAVTARRSSLDASGVEHDVIEANSVGVWGNDLSVAFLPSTDGDSTRFRVAVTYQNPETGETSLVEDWDRLSAAPTDQSYAPDVLRRSLYVRWNQDAPVFRPSVDASFVADTDIEDSEIIAGAQRFFGGRGGGGELSSADYIDLLDEKLAGIDDAALLVAGCAALLTASGADYTSFVQPFIDYVNVRPRLDLFFVGDLPRQHTASSPTEATQTTRTLARNISGNDFTALYWPHCTASDPIGVGKNPTVVLPPAGHVAGLYARTDARRGVWKAPAGTEATLGGVLSLEHALHDGHSDDLNPIGVNALRQMPGAGRVVWGARTLRPSTEWRYVPVRRTAIFLRTSIYNGIQWAVFEPNDKPLWDSLRATIGAFMEIQFRNGAFAGATSKDAYFVKVDSETTTEDDQAAGIVNILVGFAPLRPAEFVVVKLSQKTQNES